MHNWNYGLIKALEKQTKLKILPVVNFEESYEYPTIIFQMKNFIDDNNGKVIADFLISIVNGAEQSDKAWNAFKLIGNTCSVTLDLIENNYLIGQASMKIVSVTHTKQHIDISMNAFISLQKVSQK